MLMTTRMMLVLEEAPETVLSGVRVALFDRDEIIADDFLAEGVTDEQGEILFNFHSEAYTDAEDAPAWRLESLPDLYVVIYNPRGEPVYDTRSEVMQDRLPKRLLSEPVPEGGSRGQVHHLSELLPEYYQVRGWNTEGIPTRERLAALELV